jgi:hypothetical protein
MEFIMRVINITNITALTNAACEAGDKLFHSCTALQSEFKGCDKAQVRSTLLPIIATYYGVSLKTQESGRIVMQGAESDVSKATKRLNKLVAVITATVQSKVEIDVPEDILAAAAKLWALCAQYESAGKICASALATAKTGK